MAQDKKVEQITSMEDDFAQWYTDICKKAELIDYSSVKGFMILRPYSSCLAAQDRRKVRNRMVPTSAKCSTMLNLQK